MKFKVDLYSNRKKQCWQVLQYYNFPLQGHFYNINELYRDLEVDHKFFLLLSLVLVQKDGVS